MADFVLHPIDDEERPYSGMKFYISSADRGLLSELIKKLDTAAGGSETMEVLERIHLALEKNSHMQARLIEIIDALPSSAKILGETVTENSIQMRSMIEDLKANIGMPRGDLKEAFEDVYRTVEDSNSIIGDNIERLWQRLGKLNADTEEIKHIISEKDTLDKGRYEELASAVKRVEQIGVEVAGGNTLVVEQLIQRMGMRLSAEIEAYDAVIKKLEDMLEKSQSRNNKLLKETKELKEYLAVFADTNQLLQTLTKTKETVYKLPGLPDWSKDERDVLLKDLNIVVDQITDVTVTKTLGAFEKLSFDELNNLVTISEHQLRERLQFLEKNNRIRAEREGHTVFYRLML